MTNPMDRKGSAGCIDLSTVPAEFELSAQARMRVNLYRLYEL